MSDIKFCTTSKEYLPHYSYIFSKLEKLGIEMKNVECLRLWKVLHLDIQKGEEAMKISEFQKYLGGNAVCMERLVMATSGCGQLTSNDTYLSDSWFSYVKNSGGAISARVDYYGPVNTSHRGFCLATLENLMKYWPGGSYLVMKITTIVPGGLPLLLIDYKYNYRKVLRFIDTEGDVSNELGDPYYIVSMNFFLMFLFAPLFILTC